ncbi:leptin-like [Neosynchiropus ocellatus]
MHFRGLALLTLLNVVSLSVAPPPAEVKNMKLKVRWMAEQLVVRLDSPVGPTRLAITVDDFDGLSSFATILEGYSNLIFDSFHDYDQVKAEISSLTGYIIQWRRVHCSTQQTRTPVPSSLQTLQSQRRHVHTIAMEALRRMKELLEQLLKNLEQLDTC